MSFLWSPLLYLLLLIPLIIVAYVWILRRRRKFAIRYSSLSLVREAMSHQSWLRRHLPFIFFLLSLTGLIVAFARPVATVLVPSNRATIILAIDVSRSMCSTDIAPNRLDAAKKAALDFVHRQERGRKIGVVAFAGFAELVQPPTDDWSLLENAINNLAPGRRTAIGSAILRSLDAIAEIDNHVAPSDTGAGQSSAATPTPTPKGEYAPHIIILLTDGAGNVSIGALPPQEESYKFAELIANERIKSIVINMEHAAFDQGLAQQLANHLKAPCYALSELKAESLYHTVKEEMAKPTGKK